MKFSKLLLLIVILGFLHADANGQSESNPKIQIAALIADKIRDSIGLDEWQRNQIYDLNLLLQGRKDSVWQSQPASPTLLRKGLQEVENSRDLLYQGVLTSAQMILYTERKATLITNK